MTKRILSLVFVLLLLLPLASCTDNGPANLLSFSQAQSIVEMEKLDGKKVTIIGYMSTQTPVTGAFMYLMNLPYQNCPFCIPNTQQLSNTIAVYAKSSRGFDFTDRAIRVTGIMDFGNYTDEFGFEYSYRIKDATYEILDLEDLDPTLQLWQQLASTDVVSDVYLMFDYVNFLCMWPTYTYPWPNGSDYLWAEDVPLFLEEEETQYHYGRVPGYFDDMIATIEEVDDTAFSELVAIIREAQTLADTAYLEYTNRNYTVVSEYSGVYGDGRQQYKMNNAAELENRMRSLYANFSNWLLSWEL